MKKNIGIFTYDFYPLIGGQGRHVYEIYKRFQGWSSGRFNIQVFSPCQNNLQSHQQIFSLSRRFGRNILFSFLLNLWIKRIIEKYKLDIVHLQGGPGGIFLLQQLNIPIIYTTHHTYWQQSRYIKDEFWKRIFIPFEKRGYKIADKIICVSLATKEILVKKYHIKRNKIEVVPNGVDTEKFKQIKNIKKIDNSLFFVGRLDERKGIKFLIETMPLVVEKKPNIKLFIAGRGKLLNKLKRYAKENNLENNIKFLGFVPDKDLPKWYNQAELVIVPSVFEGFGITVLEAMACGVPVIATNVDGIKDIIKNNENGILVEYGSKNELTTQIIRLLNNSQLRKKISEEGLKTVQSKFNWDKITQRTLQLYNRLLNKDD